MPSKKDNNEERLARLEALIEEYRTKTDDAIDKIKRLAADATRRSRTAKATLRRAQSSKRAKR